MRCRRRDFAPTQRAIVQAYNTSRTFPPACFCKCLIFGGPCRGRTYSPLIKSEAEGVAQVIDDVGNSLVFTTREVLGHSSQLASICLSTAGFVALRNTVITPHPDGHTSALVGHEHGTLECTRIAKADWAQAAGG